MDNLVADKEDLLPYRYFKYDSGRNDQHIWLIKKKCVSGKGEIQERSSDSDPGKISFYTDIFKNIQESRQWQVGEMFSNC